MKHNIGIIGYGFVGLACETGFQNIANIRIYDKYKDSESLYDVVNNSDILFICVPTPMSKDGSCDTSIVEEVCFEIDKNAEERKSIVIKSTIPPGTTQSISTQLKGRHGLMFNPEFLTEKNFIQDFLNQDRIFLGSAKECENEDVAKVLDLFQNFTKTQKTPAYIGELSCVESVEMLKYATNAFLSTKVTFFNQIYDFCQALNLEFEEVKEIMLMDKRIGKSHTSVPGPDGLRGFGNKCLPKDLCALISLGFDLGIETLLLDSIWSYNLMTRENFDWKDILGATTDNPYKDE